MKDTIDRFIKIQKKDFKIALKEIKNGYKESHWMWYIFPQIKGLGKSDIAEYYSIKNIEEAKEYLNNNYLKDNLEEICNELLKLESDNAEEIFGFPDNLKLKSSMTLFDYVEPNNTIYKQVLNKFYDGESDRKTIEIIDKLL